MELKLLTKEDWQFSSELCKRFPHLAEFLGYKDVTDWVVDLIKKPLVYLYETEDSAGLICTLRIAFNKVLYSDNVEESKDESLEVLYYCLPPNSEVEVEYNNVIGTQFQGKAVNSHNILEVKEELNGSPETTSTNV